MKEFFVEVYCKARKSSNIPPKIPALLIDISVLLFATIFCWLYSIFMFAKLLVPLCFLWAVFYMHVAPEKEERKYV